MYIPTIKMVTRQGTPQYWQLASAACPPHGRTWHSWCSLRGFAEREETRILTPSRSHMPCWTSGASKYTTWSSKGAITSPSVITLQPPSVDSRKSSGRNWEGTYVFCTLLHDSGHVHWYFVLQFNALALNPPLAHENATCHEPPSPLRC